MSLLHFLASESVRELGDTEEHPLLDSKAAYSPALNVVVKPLRYVDVPDAVDTTSAAFIYDPLRAYQKDTPDSRGKDSYRKMRRAMFIAALSITITEKSRQILTVERGRAVAHLTQAENVRRDTMDKVLDKLINAIGQVLPRTLTPQQRERAQRLRGKFKICVEAVGPRLQEMVILETLATHPSYQGKGYGGALVDAVTAYADALGRATFLVSSNVANTFFYESHGFVTVADVLVGDDDPSWDRKPFVIKAMVREPSTEKMTV